MNFLFPQALLLYFLVPIYIMLDIYFEKKKTKDLAPFGNVELLIEAVTKAKTIDLLKPLPFIVKFFILCLVIFALARPISILYLPMRDTKVMLLMDNSISMEATDIAPNRLEAAKVAAKKFVKELPQGIQIGIGLFSGNVKIIVNPSTDRIKVVNVLDRLSLKTLEPGTAIGDAILAGGEAITLGDKEFVSKDNRILVLITDGETNIGSDPIFAAAKAKVKQITIQAIGIGNPLGTIIRGGILTRLDEFTLKGITSLTGGEYFNAQNLDEMHKIYRKIKKTIKLVPEEKEITFIPLAIAFIFMILLQLLKWSKFRFS